MEHRFETMDSACSVHSNFRPPQTDEIRAKTASTLSHVPVPVPVPVPGLPLRAQKIRDRP